MSSSTRRSALRAGTITAVAAAAIVVGAAPAFAHVTAQPGQAEQGSYSVISLRVPNESDTAGTVKLEVTLPADHPITSVRTTPTPGWTATMTKAPVNPPVESHGRSITEAVRTVTWTADPGVRIAPGEFVDFPLSLGPLPTNIDQLVLPAVQTYDNGEVVAWDQPPAADGSEPERPAPSVTLTPASGEGGPTSAAAGTAAGPPASGTDTTARWLGGAGLLVGALGLGVGAGAVLRSRRTTGGDR
ncbi:YcnI family protein [Pseudonocardia sp. CA-142604]|uniref:YcnI family copper-binding membrane protein n=1 Tax=Pseudonocardia sp. CA-142604 TaxID=3240024 RepID=UPI003D8FB3CE